MNTVMLGLPASCTSEPLDSNRTTSVSAHERGPIYARIVRNEVADVVMVRNELDPMALADDPASKTFGAVVKDNVLSGGEAAVNLVETNVACREVGRIKDEGPHHQLRTVPDLHLEASRFPAPIGGRGGFHERWWRNIRQPVNALDRHS
jgi:hypothetical protein